MIWITPTIAMDESELEFRFIRSSGPGGQNVNKVSTAVQLRYHVPSDRFPEELLARLKGIAGSRLSEDGTLIIEAREFRTQEQNREEALRRLTALLRRAAEKPKPRKPSKPSLAARQKRLETKRRRGQVKAWRKTSGGFED